MNMETDTSNTAAMREALANLVDVIDRYDSGSPLWWHCGAKGVKPLKDAKAALSAPRRNCDTDKDVKTLLEEYIAMRGFTSDNQIGALYELALPVIEWLLASTEKMKGEGNVHL